MSDFRYQVHKGDSLVVDVIYKAAAAPKAPALPVDLTGCSAVLAFRWPTGLIVLTSDDGEIVLGGAAGTITCNPVDTSDFPIGEVTGYQLRLRDSLGLEKTLLAGSIRVKPAPVEPRP